MLDEGDPSGMGNALASTPRSLHGVQRRCKHRGARPLPEPRWTRLNIHIGWAVELAWWRGVSRHERCRGEERQRSWLLRFLPVICTQNERSWGEG